MTQAIESASGLSAYRRRAAIASMIGTTIEWYDFFAYGTVGALVFPKLFFPKSDPYVGLMQTFLTYAIGFVARPLGSVFFGHYGDRIGRKTTLIITLLMMGLATALVGLMPTYATLGTLAPLGLVVLRFLQGFSAGGEWAGAVLLSVEWSKQERRGLFGSLPQLGSPFGLVLSSTVASLGLTASGTAFLSWGWRVPFLVSLALVVIGLYARLSVLETPVFREVLERRQVTRAPVAAVLRLQPRELAIASLLNIAPNGTFYVFNVFLLGYGSSILKVPRTTLVNATILGGIAAAVATLLSGYLADRIGRRTPYLLGAVALLVWALPAFALVHTRDPWLISLAMIGGFAIFGIMYGPLAAFLAEAFLPQVRYSGAGLAYNIGAIFGGGISPLIANWLTAHFGTVYSVGVYLAFLAVVGALGAVALRPVGVTSADAVADQELALDG